MPDYFWNDDLGQQHRSGLSEPDRESYVRRHVDRYQRLYEATDNPLFVWATYELVSDFCFPVPAWVRRYLVTAARNIMALAGDSRPPRSGEVARSIVTALGFAPGGVAAQNPVNWRDVSDVFREASGRFNPLVLRRAERDLGLAEAVAICVRMRPQDGVTAAVKRVAKADRISVPTVWRAVRAFPEIASPTTPSAIKKSPGF